MRIMHLGKKCKIVLVQSLCIMGIMHYDVMHYEKSISPFELQVGIHNPGRKFSKECVI